MKSYWKATRWIEGDANDEVHRQKAKAYFNLVLAT